MKKLLLHSCCAPCSSGVLDVLKDYDVTVYFYNPNIYPDEEYYKRAAEQAKFLDTLGYKYIIEEYDSPAFYEIAKGKEKEKEGGARCIECFRLRLKKTYEYAKTHGFDAFTTTLSVSPYKNYDNIVRVGNEFSDDRVEFLPFNFKKKDGYLKSIQNSKKYGLYRQDYCGCKFSIRQKIYE